MYMEEHNVLRSQQSGFCVYDSMGFSYDKMGEALEELSSWMIDGVHHNQPCLRSEDYTLLKDDTESSASRSSSKFVQRRVNCAMVVVDIAEVYKALKAGDSQPLEATRQLFCSPALRNCSKLLPATIQSLSFLNVVCFSSFFFYESCGCNKT